LWEDKCIPDQEIREIIYTSHHDFISSFIRILPNYNSKPDFICPYSSLLGTLGKCKKPSQKALLIFPFSIIDLESRCFSTHSDRTITSDNRDEFALTAINSNTYYLVNSLIRNSSEVVNGVPFPDLEYIYPSTKGKICLKLFYNILYKYCYTENPYMESHPQNGWS
jgi:hypothetical protein